MNNNVRFVSMLSFASAMVSQVSVADERPNIIYIFTDQQTASAMSCMGNADVHTPNMDRLAAAGMVFENAYCTAPLSGPSRAAMFTGYYPIEVGLGVNGTPMPDSLKNRTLGTLAREAGYECVYGGKWHVHETMLPDKKYGFDRIHEHSDEGLAKACVKFLARRHEKPFFLVASFDNPHNICEYAREQNLPYGNIEQPDLTECPGLPSNFAVSPYDADVVRMERNANYAIYPTIHYTPDDWRRFRYTYYRLVEKVDCEIGKILDEIDRLNLWENSVVIFSSDHGDGIGAHHWNQKSALYEEVVNIPLIVTVPGRKKAGTRMPQLINNGVDFYASVCEWIGVKPSVGTKGVSFKNIVEEGNPTTAHQSCVVMETFFDKGTTRGWSVRTPRYKYVLYDKGKHREQLFDMLRDRGETRNLAMEKEYDKVLAEHRDLLDKWMHENRVKPTRRTMNDVPCKNEIKF